MSRSAKPPRATGTAPAPEPRLSDAERGELQRQGAKAAARGEPAGANPLGQPRNQPPATGESADRWAQRNDAWEKGHEAQSATRHNAEPPAPPGNQDEHE